MIGKRTVPTGENAVWRHQLATFTAALQFPRLLEILAQTRDPHAVQPHMSKCFDAIFN